MKSVCIVLAGEAGQGIQTIEELITRTAKLSGLHVFATKEYMSRVRGGLNSTTVIIGDVEARGFVQTCDIFVPLTSEAVNRYSERIGFHTHLLADRAIVDEHIEDLYFEIKKLAIRVDLADMIKESGGSKYTNTLYAGILCGLLGCDQQVLFKELGKKFNAKDETVYYQEEKKAKLGIEFAEKVTKDMDLEFKPEVKDELKDRMLLNGTQAVGLGAIAGGCNFISNYPMSPATGVMVFLAEHAGRHGIFVEQAEDEISAINMGIGAWYAGAQAMVTTSGGGFALMTEGLSLAGAMESPMVIHLAQRPGPATGLPTRTEQGDLLFSIFGGHGEFPRIVYAPGSLEEAFDLTHKAFEMADKHCVPVIILTDQYFLDSYYDIEGLDLDKVNKNRDVIRTQEDYCRYLKVLDDTPGRGIPGHGEGLVQTDSDEHDDCGHITEEKRDRVWQVEMRGGKYHDMIDDHVQPILIGPEDYEYLLIGWGSTYWSIKEVFESCLPKGLAYLHFPQVWPIPPGTKEKLEQAHATVVIENNSTAQFAHLLQMVTGVEITARLLQYDGHPFTKDLLWDYIPYYGKEVRD